MPDGLIAFIRNWFVADRHFVAYVEVLIPWERNLVLPQ